MKLVNLHYHLEKFDIHHSYCEGYDEVSQSFKHTIYQDDSGKAITILKDEELLPEQRNKLKVVKKTGRKNKLAIK